MGKAPATILSALIKQSPTKGQQKLKDFWCVNHLIDLKFDCYIEIKLSLCALYKFVYV